MFIEDTEISLKVKYLMCTWILVVCFCYIFSSEFISLINIKNMGQQGSTLVIVKSPECTSKPMCFQLPLFIKFPHLKYHFKLTFNLAAKAPWCCFSFFHYLINKYSPLELCHMWVITVTLIETPSALVIDKLEKRAYWETKMTQEGLFMQYVFITIS